MPAPLQLACPASSLRPPSGRESQDPPAPIDGLVRVRKAGGREPRSAGIQDSALSTRGPAALISISPAPVTSQFRSTLSSLARASRLAAVGVLSPILQR